MKLGLVSAGGTLLYGRVLGRLRGGRGPALVFVAAALGTLPLLAWPSPSAALASAVLFGGSVVAVAAATARSWRANSFPPPTAGEGSFRRACTPQCASEGGCGRGSAALS